MSGPASSRACRLVRPTGGGACSRRGEMPPAVMAPRHRRLSFHEVAITVSYGPRL
jgi:hypothetical protein